MTKPIDRGFTLMELMITVVIIAVLALIVYPSYVQYTTAARRTDAYTGLAQLNNDMEKFYSECGSYTSNITGTRSCTTPSGPPSGNLGKTSDKSTNGYYQFSISLPSPGNYTLTATAIGIQANDNDCKTLTLSSTGAESATAGSGGNTSRCWRK